MSVEIEGVTLTMDAITQLQNLQKKDNEDLDAMRVDIADAVCFLASCLDDLDNPDNGKIILIMNNLSHHRDNVNNLRKP